ncbi:MAG: hypothetical protein R2771_05415 [Saprospiraceae bacterium]
MDYSNQISLKEANRILKEALIIADIVGSKKDTVLFNYNNTLNQGGVIYYNSVKIKEIDLRNFPYFKNKYKIKLINSEEIKSDNEIVGYWNITFRRLNDGLLRLGISSNFYIPKSRQPMEIDGMYFYFNYKIVNGKAELMRWRGL